MKKLTISSFKAFGDTPVVFGGETDDGQPMNLLCYGENGSGKTSVYEAIKYAFHKERIERERIPARFQGQERINACRQILIDYKNKKSVADPIIEINGSQFETFNKDSYNVYMLNGNDIKVNGFLDLDVLLKSLYLAKHNIDTELTDESFLCIISEVNLSLKNFFYEGITLTRSQNATFRIVIQDDSQNLISDDHLNLLFNEAKLNLVALLLALESIQLFAPPEKMSKKILVLDDVFTSLDTANRMFLYQYFITKFGAFQIILLTHNTSFYNLCDFFLKEDDKINRRWLRQGIYEYNECHKVYAISTENEIASIESELNNNPENIHSIGNEVRQYFEVLLHRYTILLMAGAKEELSNLLVDIQKKCTIRSFHVTENKIETNNDLIKSIVSVLKDAPPNCQLLRIKKVIDRFNDSNNGVDKLAEQLQAMTIYQKVALHQSSHGHQGLPDLSSKEIKASLVVLRKMEDTIKKMKIERI